MRLEAHAHQVKVRWLYKHSQDRETRKGWLKTCNAAVAPLVSFDSKENLQSREVMYTAYAMIGLHRDRSYKSCKTWSQKIA